MVMSVSYNEQRRTALFFSKTKAPSEPIRDRLKKCSPSLLECFVWQTHARW
jgi:hypothetical protein